MIRVDFHNHSSCSDGLLSPSEMIKRAYNNDVKYFSLTDHDTVNGLKEASTIAKDLNITFIPGVELSTNYNNESIHVLGYFKDDSYNNTEFLTFLDNIKNKRVIRAKQIVEKLDECFNIKISLDNVLKRGKEVVARPHIAYEIMDSGYNYDMEYIFDNFIGKDCPAYVPTTKITTEEGIDIIHKNNGLAFLAHPVLIKNTSLSTFLDMNIDGIEAIYFQNTKEEETKLISFAKEHNLLISCGSDCHGNFVTDIRHGDIGSMKMKEDDLNKFLASLQK